MGTIDTKRTEHGYRHRAIAGHQPVLRPLADPGAQGFLEGAPHPHPVIVGGDFNAEEHSHEIKALTEIEGWIDSFRHLNEDVGHTWGQMLAEATATAGRRIDFLFSVPSREERWTPSHSRLVLNRAFPQRHESVLWASDHYGVLTVFEAPSTLRNCAE